MSDQGQTEAAGMLEPAQDRINQILELAQEGKATPEDLQELQVLVEQRSESQEALAEAMKRQHDEQQAITEHLN